MTSTDPHGSDVRSGKDRRELKDRRKEIRYEPDNPDRRQNKGRREEDNDLWTKAMSEQDTSN